MPAHAVRWNWLSRSLLSRSLVRPTKVEGRTPAGGLAQARERVCASHTCCHYLYFVHQTRTPTEYRSVGTVQKTTVGKDRPSTQAASCKLPKCCPQSPRAPEHARGPESRVRTSMGPQGNAKTTTVAKFIQRFREDEPNARHSRKVMDANCW